jgi:8-oxo-dGTP pyrophosphatase MutT (NUDIX family)
VDDLRRKIGAHKPKRLLPARFFAGSSVAVVVREADRSILFLKRAEREGDPWSGDICFPGGRREPGDFDSIATAIREAREEIGLLLERSSLAGPLSPILAPTHARNGLMIIEPFVFLVSGSPRFELSREIRDAFWIPIESLEREAIVRPLLGVALRFSAYRWQGHVIWGLTHKVLTELLDITRWTPR